MINQTSHQPRHALVTGADGFIGSNVVRVLIEEGVRVRALALPDNEAQNLRGLDIDIVRGDLRDPASLRAVVDGCDTVYHLGAIFDYWIPVPVEMFRVNVEGTIHLLRAARQTGVKRVVHCSSVAAIGTLPGEALADEETPFNNWETADDYTFSKYIAENEAVRFSGPDLEVVCGLPCLPFGRNDITPTPTGLLAQRYVLGQNPSVFTGGANVVNVRDVARGLHLCATRGRPGESYILGGHNVTYAEFGRVLCAAAGSKVPRYTINPARLAWLGRLNEWFARWTGIKPYFADKGMRFLGGRYLYFDIGKAKAELGYEPTGLEETLSETARWFLDERDRVLGGEVVHPADKPEAADTARQTVQSLHAE
ncbi:MAG: NAD-dependent epimerase/dehydratase family protein [Myxococcota bacterium]